MKTTSDQGSLHLMRLGMEVNYWIGSTLPVAKSNCKERTGSMRREPLIAIVNACIWGAVIIAAAMALKGTGAFEKIQLILGGGAAASLLVVSSGIRRTPKK